ncbi:hypothetical protein GCM10010405_23970 [Streptomyces macrosporus]|uniref:Transposase n=1 Tax=Streptomyces macrosporus TaxID=44032 RepID=A0ABP5WY09_9ACTN
MQGIVYALCKGVSRADAPTERIGRSEVTVRRRPREGTEAGVRPPPHEILPAEPRKAGLPDMDDAALDGSHVRALPPRLGRPAPEAGQARAVSSPTSGDVRPVDALEEGGDRRCDGFRIRGTEHEARFSGRKAQTRKKIGVGRAGT